MSEIVAAIFVAIGVLFNLFGCIGLVRFPDVYTRLQAATKCVTLGTCLTLGGVAVYGFAGGFGAMGMKSLLCIGFLVITAPTAAHALARGAYKYGVKLKEPTVVDLYQQVEPQTTSIENEETETA